jgi:DNA-binding HxlR family transcriptional regulator
MKRTSLEGARCPVARSLDAIGDWWSLLIIRDALDGVRRFGQFQKSLGISKGILTARLKRLLSLEILNTAPVADDGAYREYVLTQKGRDLFLVVVSLRQWGEDYCFERSETHSILIDNESRQPVERLVLRSKDGRILDQSSTNVQKVPNRRRRQVTNPAPKKLTRRPEGNRVRRRHI